MKRLDTSAISASVAMPVKSGTLEFLQDAYKEGLQGVVKSFLDVELPNTIYVLQGCKNTGSGANYILSDGILYLNGEIFQFAATTFTLVGLEKAYARIETTQFTVNADPVQFTDGIPRNVHNVRTLVVENTITSSGLPEFEDFIPLGKYFKGETKEIVMDATEIGNKFVAAGPTAGLGKFEYIGWAIMNGNNNTVNDAGRVVVAYGTGFVTPGATGGAATHTLSISEMPNHHHQALLPGGGLAYDAGAFSMGVQDTNSVGGGAAHNNMQPYVVRLRIQKI